MLLMGEDCLVGDLLLIGEDCQEGDLLVIGEGCLVGDLLLSRFTLWPLPLMEVPLFMLDGGDWAGAPLIPCASPPGRGLP